jgi:hypothetical protein
MINGLLKSFWFGSTTVNTKSKVGMIRQSPLP